MATRRSSLRRWSLRLSIFAAALAALVACSFGFDGDAFLTAGRDGGPDAGTDAAVITEDAAETEGGCDATFCDEFDREPAGAGWTAVSAGRDTTLDLDPSESRSPPSSLRLTTTANDGGEDVEAWLEKDLGAGKAIRCAFSMLSRMTPALYHADFFTITAEAPDVRAYAVLFALTPNALYVREDIGLLDGGCDCPRAATEKTLAALPPSWVRVMIEVDFVTVSLFLDDVLVHRGPIGGFTPTRLAVRLGLSSRRGADTLLTRYDDFTCTVTR